MHVLRKRHSSRYGERAPRVIFPTATQASLLGAPVPSTNSVNALCGRQTPGSNGSACRSKPARFSKRPLRCSLVDKQQTRKEPMRAVVPSNEQMFSVRNSPYINRALKFSGGDWKNSTLNLLTDNITNAVFSYPADLLFLFRSSFVISLYRCAKRLHCISKRLWPDEGADMLNFVVRQHRC